MNKKQQRLQDVLDFDFDSEIPRVDDLSKVPKGYRGEVLEINDHGNVTLWYHFKNGNCREIASRV